MGKYIDWTFEKCEEEALKHKTTSEWYNNSPYSYRISKKRNWLDKCSLHMIHSRFPRNYWTKEKCKENALNYNTISEWIKNGGSAYNKALKNNWLDDCIKHMSSFRNPNGYWTINECKKEALKFKTRSEWQKLSTSSYCKAQREKWLNECCKHMIQLQKPNGYWTINKCYEEAKKYTSRSEWEKKSSTSYNLSRKNSWLDECCKHMIKKNPLHLKLIYAFEFSDKSVYIGLTSDFNRRKEAHLKNKKSVVFMHLYNSKSRYIYRKLTEYVDEKMASKLETEYLNDYKSKGWNILNTGKTGGLGGGRIVWTKNKCLNEAKKYSKISDWRKYSINSYQAALRNKLLKECTLHMERYLIKKPPIKMKFWTLEKCKMEALKYNTIQELRQNSSGTYYAIHENKWSDICFSHMKKLKINGK